MKRNQILSGVLAAAFAISLSSAASAQNYGSKAANLQAMRWYAQQQMAKGMPNPYPGVNLYTGQGFSQFRRGATSGYMSNYGYSNNPWYGNNFNSYGNSPWYGNNNFNRNNMYNNPWYGNTGGSWY